LNMTFFVYERRAGVVAARSNFSMLSVINEDAATINTDIDLERYQEALRWLLDFKAAGIPAASSIVEFFWSAPLQLTNTYWSIELRQAMQSVLAFPLWVFNANNYGNIALAQLNDTSSVAAEYHTTAAVASPFTRIVVNRSMFILFVVLEVGRILKQY
jgi:hypothetical protein